jgi:outer membrane lipoprotein LolB
VSRLAWLSLVGLLAGCAGRLPPPLAPTLPPAQQAWDARVAALTPLTTWALEGRLAVQRDKEGGQARLQWRQQGAAFELRIIAPLAQGTSVLWGDTGAVALVTADGHRYTAPDVDVLMATHLNWSLPVAGARYWVLGLPAPGHPIANIRYDDSGRLSDLAQDGWRISVLDYQDVAGTSLPRKLFLLGDKLQLRMVITQWPVLPH